MKRVITTLLLMTLSSFALTLGEVPQKVTLLGENGGLVNNEAWSSSTIKDKVYQMVAYIHLFQVVDISYIRKANINQVFSVIVN